MDYFKSVFSDEPAPSNLENSPESIHIAPPDEDPDQETGLRETNSNANPNPKSSAGSAWSFGGLLKTVASKSETVIQTYRRDLEEFGSELKKETAAFREAASRAVKDLPVSIEAGASVAQGSLESVGKAIDGFGSSVWGGTAEILSNSKDDVENDPSDSLNVGSSKRFSRFEMQVHAVQADLNTYCQEPNELDEFNKWKLGFVMEEKAEDIEDLIGEKGVMGEVYAKLVPGVIDDEIFWSRYFYRIYKLKQAEEARANLVKRVVSGEVEEDWSWDVDDDESNGGGKELEEKESAELAMGMQGKVVDKEVDVVVSTVVESKAGNGSGEKTSFDKKGDLTELNGGETEEKESPEYAMEKQKKIVDSNAPAATESDSDNGSVEKVSLDKNGDLSELNSGELVTKLSEKEGFDGKTGEFCKVSELSLPEEEDIGWDEIEDIGSDNDKRVAFGQSSNRADLRRQLNAEDEEEEEDLSWDIEDDDVPLKH